MLDLFDKIVIGMKIGCLSVEEVDKIDINDNSNWLLSSFYFFNYVSSENISWLKWVDFHLFFLFFIVDDFLSL